jgi:hypothetical protein
MSLANLFITAPNQKDLDENAGPAPTGLDRLSGARHVLSVGLGLQNVTECKLCWQIFLGSYHSLNQDYAFKA